MRSSFWLLLSLVGCATAPLHPQATETVTTPAPKPAVTATWSDRSYEPFDMAAYRALALQPLDIEHLNTDLLSAAIFLETNNVRHREGLQPLKSCGPCRVAAQRYTDDMVRLNFFDPQHGHPDASLATPKQRMDAAHLTGATAWGENIAVAFGLKYKSGEPFYEPSAPGQPFLDMNNQPIPLQTYESFAVAVLTQWMNSPHHRANILDGDFTHIGAACTGFREKDGFPKLKCSQDFTRLPPGSVSQRSPADGAPGISEDAFTVAHL